jgi:hypothetical protein
MSYTWSDFTYDFWCVLGRNEPQDTLCIYHFDIFMKMSEEEQQAHHEKQQQAFRVWRSRQEDLYARLFIAFLIGYGIYSFFNPSDGCTVEYIRGRAVCE